MDNRKIGHFEQKRGVRLFGLCWTARPRIESLIMDRIATMTVFHFELEGYQRRYPNNSRKTPAHRCNSNDRVLVQDLIVFRAHSYSSVSSMPLQ